MSFSKYPEYKDSGVEWLGEVPAHWEVSRLKFFGELITGITPPSEDLSNYSEAGWPWIRPDDLDDQGGSVQASKFLTDQGWSYCRPVASMSTLVCCIGSIGKLGYTVEVTCTNQQITAIQPFYDARYLFYLVCASKSELDLRATGNVLRILNAERLGNVPAPMPSVDESAQIATFLDQETARIDALIEEQQRLIELLKEKRQAVISHAVTKGLDPDVPMKDSGVEWLGQVPAHWDVKRLRYAIELNPSKSEVRSLAPGTPVTFIPMESIGEDGTLSLDQTRPIDEVLAGYTYAREGDVAIAKITPCFENGKGAVMRNLEQGIAFGTTELIVMRPKGSLTTSDYLYRISTSESFRALGESEMYGAGGQKRVPDNFVRNFAIAWPPYEDQLMIQAFLDQETARIDALVKEAESAIELLQERRSALISAAVTGKIDVRGWQPPAGSSTSAEATQTETV